MAKVEQNQGRQAVPDEVNIFIKVKEGIEKAHPPMKEDELNIFYFFTAKVGLLPPSVTVTVIS